MFTWGQNEALLSLTGKACPSRFWVRSSATVFSPFKHWHPAYYRSSCSMCCLLWLLCFTWTVTSFSCCFRPFRGQGYSFPVVMLWRMNTFEYNRAPLLSTIKPYASFHHHMWIQTGVTVRKRLSWVVTSVTLTFDLWPWPFAWTSLPSLVITPENFMMIRWWEHSQKGVTDGRTDRQTDGRTDRRKIPFVELLGRS